MPGTIEAVDLAELGVLLVAHARIDDHRSRPADDERTHRERDPVAIVRGRLGRPKRFRYDAEHRPPVQLEESIADGNELQIADHMSSHGIDPLRRPALRA